MPKYVDIVVDSGYIEYVEWISILFLEEEEHPVNFTSKEEYGLRAVMHLAAHEAAWPIQARSIASAEGIPEQFLEQLLAALRRAGIVRSVRGAGGGYELARSARSITAGDVIRALSGPIASVPSQGEADQPGGSAESVVAGLMKRVQSAVAEVLDGTTIQDMVDERVAREHASSYAMNI